MDENSLNAEVLIVGAGPGGYVSAIRAGQLGLKTILVEKDEIGGTCLNRGCIPSKALIHVAERFHHISIHAKKSHLGIDCSSPPKLNLAESMKWKDEVCSNLRKGIVNLLVAAGVRVLKGEATFNSDGICEVAGQNGMDRIKADKVIIATGSKPVELPHIPFGGRVISSTEALNLSQVPSKMAVIGAGVIGLELGMVYAKLGTEVSVIEMLDSILPGMDSELTRPVMVNLRKMGIKVHLGAMATGVQETNDEIILTFKDKKGVLNEVAADNVLVTVGRVPEIEGLGIENLGLSCSDDGLIPVDGSNHTEAERVWAIGDIVSGLQLAHRASAEGERVAERIAGLDATSLGAVPSVCYTDPEVVIVGLNPSEVEESKIGRFPLSANGRALTQEAGKSLGFVRIIADQEGVIVGAGAVGPNVSELSGELTLMVDRGVTLVEASQIIHAHPTLSEAIQESAASGLGHSIHSLN